MLSRRLARAATLAGLIPIMTAYTAAGPRPKVVNLSVVIEDTLSDGTPATIRGDGAAYINGQDGVQAQLASDGSVWANFWPQVDSGVRTVSFNHAFPAPYPSPETEHPELIFVPPAASVNVINPRMSAAAGPVALQSLAIGTSECLMLWWGTASSVHGWRDNFHFGNANRADSLASFAVATRNSATTWTVESNRGLGSCPNLNQTTQESIAIVVHDETITVPGRHGSSSSTNYVVMDGYYFMPFRMTLTALP